MAERHTTGSSPLLDIIKEVYDTKLRMKQVLNTQSDDFEEYATITYNYLVDEYNKGWKDGYIDGFHSIMPTEQIDPSDYESGYKEHKEFIPADPQWTTDTTLGNLIVMMKDNYRCRLLLKDALETESNEFVTYPDLYNTRIAAEYGRSYDISYQEGYDDAFEKYEVPEITFKYNIITITIGDEHAILTYSINGSEFQEYTGPIEIFEDVTIVVKAYHESDPPVVVTRSFQYIDYATKYFTVISLVDNNVIQLKIEGQSGEFTFYYSTDEGNTWTSKTISSSSSTGVTTTVNIVTLNKGGRALFKNTDWLMQGWRFYSTNSAEIEGNILSLWYGDNFINKTSIGRYSGGFFAVKFEGWTQLLNANRLILPITHLYTDPETGVNIMVGYQYMFKDCTSLIYGPKVLPATEMSGGSYYRMFMNCTSLRVAPEISATELREECFFQMFKNCTSLVSGPSIIPASQMVYNPDTWKNANDCCYEMFMNCTSLVNAPALPATTVSNKSYHCMFKGCTSLVNAPALPATDLTYAEYCYSFMFEGCTSLVNAPALPATTLGKYCYDSMFKDCTSLTTAPELLVGTLVQGCYYDMFYRCSRLNYIKCLATVLRGNNWSGTGGWVYGVSQTGTFMRAAAATDWWRDQNGIPEGWDVLLWT